MTKQQLREKIEKIVDDAIDNHADCGGFEDRYLIVRDTMHLIDEYALSEQLDLALDVVYQYAYQPEDGVYTTGGMSTIENAFSVLRKAGLLEKDGRFIPANSPQARRE